MIDYSKLIHHLLFCFCSFLMMQHIPPSWNCSFLAEITIRKTILYALSLSGFRSAFKFFTASCACRPRCDPTFTSNTSKYWNPFHFHDALLPNRRSLCLIGITVAWMMPVRNPSVIGGCRRGLSWAYAWFLFMFLRIGSSDNIPCTFSRGSPLWLYHLLFNYCMVWVYWSLKWLLFEVKWGSPVDWLFF